MKTIIYSIQKNEGFKVFHFHLGIPQDEISFK